MTLGPIYSDHLIHQDFIPIKGKRLETAITKLKSDPNIHAISYFENRVNNKKNRFIVEWESDSGKWIEQEYPGVLILWYLKTF